MGSTPGGVHLGGNAGRDLEGPHYPLIKLAEGGARVGYSWLWLLLLSPRDSPLDCVAEAEREHPECRCWAYWAATCPVGTARVGAAPLRPATALCPVTDRNKEAGSARVMQSLFGNLDRVVMFHDSSETEETSLNILNGRASGSLSAKEPAEQTQPLDDCPRMQRMRAGAGGLQSRAWPGVGSILSNCAGAKAARLA